MPLTMRSTRSGSTGRLRSATSTERMQLVAVERHAPAGALDHGQLAQLHPLEGGEAAAAIRADAAAADRGGSSRRAANPSPGCRRLAAVGTAHDVQLSTSPESAIDREAARAAPSDLRRACTVRPRTRRDCRPRSLPPSPAPSSTSTISSPTCWNSATPKPRVVPAGVPRRMPEVTVGFSGSNGMPFLLQVMWARPSAASAALPVSFFGRRSTSIRWVSVPPETMSKPPRLAASRPAPWRSRPRSGVELELRLQRLAEGHGLGGDDVHQRAALQAGEDRRVDLLGDVLVVGEDHAAARAAQGLVRGGGDDMGVRERARMQRRRRPGPAKCAMSTMK